MPSRNNKRLERKWKEPKKKHKTQRGRQQNLSTKKNGILTFTLWYVYRRWEPLNWYKTISNGVLWDINDGPPLKSDSVTELKPRNDYNKIWNNLF